MSARDAGKTLLRAAVGLSLLAYPPRERRRFGREIGDATAALVAGRWQRHGAWSAIFMALRAWLDILAAGIRQRRPHLAALQPSPRRSARRPLGPGEEIEMEMDNFWTDLRHAARRLLKTPAFTLSAIVVLALGIGANGAMFNALRETLIAPPPYPDPDELVLLHLTWEHPARGRETDWPWSYPKYQLLAGASDLPVESLSGYSGRTVALSGEGDPVQLEVEMVSPSYFETLGVAPALGRSFEPEDESSASPPQLAVVLDHGLFESRFGSDPSLIGRTIVLNGNAVEVVGVMPPGFRGLTGQRDAWLTMSAMPVLAHPRQLEWPHGHWFYVVARLEEGVTTEQLESRIEVVGQAVAEKFPDPDETEAIYGATSRSLVEARRNPTAATSLLVLVAGAALVLLIACANLTALFASRAAERRRDAAVRAALGASRSRLLRGLLFESALLGLLGGLAGLLVVRFANLGLARFWPESFHSGGARLEFSTLEGLAIDTTSVLFALGLSLLTGLLFGLGPALRLAGAARHPHSSLRSGLGFLTAGRRIDPRALLVGVQVGLALILLIGAGLLFSSLSHLQDFETGFDTENLLAFSYEIPRSHPSVEHPAGFHEQFLERMAALPEVEGVTLGCPPLNGHCWITGVGSTDLQPEIPHDERPGIGIDAVGDDHFRTLGIPLLEGRTFTPADRADSEPVMVLGETAARELFGEESAVGHRLQIGIGLTSGDTMAEVIGVVGDVLYEHPSEGIMADAYVSYRQEPDRYATVMVRTRGEPLAVVSAARAILAELDPTLPIYGITTIDDLGHRAIADTRVLSTLLLVFAGLGLLLAATGTYGVVAYWVSQRRRELGLRMALGARTGQVAGMVVHRGLTIAAIGVAAGALVGLLTTRLLEGLLFGVTARDPLAFLGGAAVLLLVAGLASYLPARQATRVDPAQTLRAE